MSRFVIDASAATEYLLRTPLGLKVATTVEEASLIAPELIDVEVLSVLRRAVWRRELPEQRAIWAVEDLVDWSIDRIPTQTARLVSLGSTVTTPARTMHFTSPQRVWPMHHC